MVIESRKDRKRGGGIGDEERREGSIERKKNEEDR